MQHLAKDIFDLVSPDNSVSFLLSAQLPRSLSPFPLSCNVLRPGVLPHTSLQETCLSQHPLTPAWSLHEDHMQPTLPVAGDHRAKAKAVAEVREPLFLGAQVFCPTCFPSYIPLENHPHTGGHLPLLEVGLGVGREGAFHSLFLCSWKSQTTLGGVFLIVDQL